MPPHEPILSSVLKHLNTFRTCKDIAVLLRIPAARARADPRRLLILAPEPVLVSVSETVEVDIRDEYIYSRLLASSQCPTPPSAPFSSSASHCSPLLTAPLVSGSRPTRDRPKPAPTYIRAPSTFSLRAAHSEPQLAHSLNVPPLSAWPAHFVGRRVC
ncbi:hypothetical protein B0H13DRAFT_2337594 [Mycena leptocephala]|nr:hypothetical protein B0H13DRAFT_2337594 [Mycena leptocephala]